MLSKVGMLVSMQGSDYLSVNRSQIGFVLYGPYSTLDPGHYEVEFNFFFDAGNPPAAEEIVCKIDVVRGLGTDILVREDVTVAQLTKDKQTKVTLSFSLSEETPHMEFRAWSLGKADFAVAVERRVKLISGPPSWSLRDAEFGGEKGFCDQNAETLRTLSVQGAKITRRPDSALISLGGVNVVARHREDFQLVSEVLVFNTYNIMPLKDSIVVDVGMNIGLASAFFAKQNWAKKVYAFEPFRDPFERSKETFDNNADVKNKIVARNAGLSDKNERPFVHYSTDGTIATGIKGVASGPVQQLEILDAGEVFQAICAEAEQSGLGVVVKLDCEGSEFPIMKRISELGLLVRINAFMIEWHKVWSPDVSLKDLTNPLRENGFVIFDHTVEADFFAGMLYAVKA